MVRLAEQHRIPALYPGRGFVDLGGLMDYAYIESGRGRSAAEYISQILHGASPAALPMRPPPDIELVINLQAAQLIGYTFPDSVVAKATDVIR
jgi:putative ABC transport system substrate-binding protein